MAPFKAKRSSKYLRNLGAGPEPVRDGCPASQLTPLPALLLNTRLPAIHLSYEITRMTTKRALLESVSTSAN